MKFNLKNLLQNKTVLYIVLFLSVTSMFSYLMSQNYAPVLFFITIAFLTNYFSKNMIIVLGIAVLTTNLLTSTTNVFSRHTFKEGLEGKDDEDYDEDDSKDDNEDHENDNKKDILKEIKKDLSKAKNDTEKLEKNPKHKDHKHNHHKCSDKKKKTECTDHCEWDSESKTCKARVKSSFQNLNPASYPSSDKSKPNLDEAGTIEAAYDNLDSIMGSDSIRSMTADTQKLADRQKELIDQLKNVAPLINQTTKMISSFNMDGKLQGMIDGLTKNISQINSKPPEGAEE